MYLKDIKTIRIALEKRREKHTHTHTHTHTRARAHTQNLHCIMGL